MDRAKNDDAHSSVDGQMGAQPKISIVTPSYNHARYLEECLLSVKEQNYPNVEHIVVDDGSTDNSLEILNRRASTPGWAHLQQHPEPHCGQSPTLNKGFRMATGDIVGWLNSDDRYRPACFQTVADAFQAYPKADIIYGDFTCIDESGRMWQIRREIRFSRFVLSYHRVSYVATNTAFFRRRVFDEGNFIDPQFNYALDYEFFMRLARGGYRFQHISYLLADYRWHPLSTSFTHTAEQRAEHDRIAQSYSPVLKKLRSSLPNKFALRALRLMAAGRRYAEKFVRGYYFEQFRPSDGTAIAELRRSWHSRGPTSPTSTTPFR